MQICNTCYLIVGIVWLSPFFNDKNNSSITNTLRLPTFRRKYLPCISRHCNIPSWEYCQLYVWIVLPIIAYCSVFASSTMCFPLRLYLEFLSWSLTSLPPYFLYSTKLYIEEHARDGFGFVNTNIQILFAIQRPFFLAYRLGILLACVSLGGRSGVMGKRGSNVVRYNQLGRRLASSPFLDSLVLVWKPKRVCFFWYRVEILGLVFIGYMQ